jgi:predicted helicase
MPKTASIKPTHKPIKQYYAALQSYREHKVTHEGALETAFQHLLDETAKTHGWKLIPKQKLKVGKHTLYPDGTLRDIFNMRCGFWEAKDTDDNLDAEIQKKIAKGYPLTNTIFEDTRQAVLFQGGQERYRFDLTDGKQLAALLNEFYAYTEPEIDSFHQAVDEFKSQVPELARSLVQILANAHQSNRKFQAAFDDFFALCQTALNPNISQAAVDEMLVQHLLTERLIRKIFDNPEFTRRNVIAVELEKVIDSLVSLSFNRDSFLRRLDRFYRAIEEAARGLEDFGEKQHFLNTVYERFFQGYSVKVADTHGIVYTPQEIVDFMCASVAEVLETEFGLSLSSPGVYIVDPCTGTGNFIVNLIRRMPKKDLARMYREQLFANEVMLLPYYIAALNIEHAYFEQTSAYEPFEGLCFVDTLDLAREAQSQMFSMVNTARVDRQRRTPITVIVGNPPYNMGQQNENDANKNRRYKIIDDQIKSTYAKESRATLKNKLYDAYVKFFRWATDRLEDRDGLVCLVTNNSFINQVAFDGMRKHLLQDFTLIYHLDMHGNVQHNPKLSGTTHNVFGIRLGVGITLAIRKKDHASHRLLYHRLPEDLRREEKLAWLGHTGSASAISWRGLTPDSRHTWLLPDNAHTFMTYLPIGSKEAKARGTAETIFKIFSLGVATNRDEWVYDSSVAGLETKVKRCIENYDYEVFRLSRTSKRPVKLEEFINTDLSYLKWTDRLIEALREGRSIRFDESHIRNALYRPFTRCFLYFDHLLNQRRYQQHRIYPIAASEGENNSITVTTLGSEKPFMVLMAKTIVDLHLVGAGCGSQCFPFYVYDQKG